MNGPVALILAYLAGSIPFGYLVARFAAGVDVRSVGSGNIGATNVFRTTSRLAGLLTLVLDAFKGWAAVKVAGWFTGDSLLWMSSAALVVMLGHAFPVFLKFRGGKAVASFIGAWLVLQPLPLLACLIVFVVTVWITRYISLGSVLAAGSFPFAVWLIHHPPAAVKICALLSGALIVWRHEANLRRLRAGTEHVFTFRRRPQ